MQRISLLWLQHITNPLHLYCRLLDLGLSMSLSRRIGRIYERIFYTYLVRGIKN
jgi:hypothetical protein